MDPAPAPAPWPTAESLLSRRAFLFDFDGTLLDSSPVHDAGYRAALGAHRPDLLAAFDYARIKGLTTAESFGALGIAPGAACDAMVRIKQEHHRAAFLADGLPLFPGALELLDLLRGRLRVLVTSSHRASVQAIAERTGLASRLDGLVAAEDVARGKPDPEPFLAALRRWELRPDEAIVVEDAASGLASARAAGLDALQVNGPPLVPAIPCFPSLGDLARHLAAGRPRA